MKEKSKFYFYQRNRMLVLLSWGLGSMVSGLFAFKTTSQFWRQFWLQCFSWGLIDALLAAFALKGISKKQGAQKRGEINAENIKRDIQGYHRILFVNIFLDILYIFSGEWIRRWGKSKGKPKNKELQQGLGAGFIFQGLFLLVYDLYLDIEVNLGWRSKINN